jgi:intracellular septation protein A
MRLKISLAIMSHNPYLPPSTTQFAEVPKYRTDFGFRLAWSLFWRVLLLQWFGMWAITALRFAGLDDSWLKPVNVFIASALIQALSLLFTKRGILFFLFGDRIALPAAAWRKFHWLLAAFYGAMAAWSLAVIYLLGEMSPTIRIAISFASWVLFFAIATRSLRGQHE